MLLTRPRTCACCAFIALATAGVFPGPAAAAEKTKTLRAEIKGRLTSDAVIEATRIRLREPDRGSKIEGAVRSIDVPSRRIDIGGLIAVLAADASVQRDDNTAGALDDVTVGAVVEVKGKWSGTQLDASRLRIRAARSPEESPGDEIEIEADVDWNGGRRPFRVLGHPLGLVPGGKVTDERAAAAQPRDTTERTPVSNDRLRRDVDDQQAPPIRIGDWLTLGGRIGGDLWNQEELDAISTAGDRERKADAIAQLLASATVGRHVELYTKIGASRALALQPSDSAGAGEPIARLYEAYVAVAPLGPVGLQIGRQRFRDAREWFFDDYLDAVRLHVRRGTWRVETAIADSILSGARELRDRTGQRQTIATLNKRFGRRSDATGFLIKRDDRNRRERPMWMGAEWNGRVTDDVKSWAIGAVRRGESTTERLGGWAIDTGAAARLPIRLGPSFAMGYATSSGDATGGDGVDSRFRQTGLDDNTARFFGVKRFAQYGEVLNPELSNLTVLTVGAGMQPFARSSLDVVYHRYVQRSLRRSLPSNNLEAIGTGRSRQLGDGVDLVLAVQRWPRLDLSVICGVFRPGAAVSAPARPVVYWKPEFRVFF